MIRRKTRKTKSLFKSCPMCGLPLALKDRAMYEWYIGYSPIWKSVRLWALERAGNKCEKCGASFPLEVHHKTYTHLGKEEPRDLIVLCQECHEKEHGK